MPFQFIFKNFKLIKNKDSVEVKAVQKIRKETKMQALNNKKEEKTKFLFHG